MIGHIVCSRLKLSISIWANTIKGEGDFMYKKYIDGWIMDYFASSTYRRLSQRFPSHRRRGNFLCFKILKISQPLFHVIVASCKCNSNPKQQLVQMAYLSLLKCQIIRKISTLMMLSLDKSWFKSICIFTITKQLSLILMITNISTKYGKLLF